MDIIETIKFLLSGLGERHVVMIVTRVIDKVVEAFHPQIVNCSSYFIHEQVEFANIAGVQQHLRSIYNGRLNVYPSKATYLEVMDLKGSKSNSVKFVSERLGLDRTEIIAMGDNYNDIEMIKYAGMGVAMGNAPDDIKAIADYVTDTNNNDGVRKALEKFFNLTPSAIK